MRTTIDLDPEILRHLKERQRAQGKSLGQVASELLAKALSEEATPERPYQLRWPVRSMGQPLVDIDDKEALHRELDADVSRD